MVCESTICSRDLPRAREFYDVVLGVIGAKRVKQYGDNMEGFTMWGTEKNPWLFSVSELNSEEPASIGICNMAVLCVDNRVQVDELHAKALELKGTCEGPPGVRGDEGPEANYSASFNDLDGNLVRVSRIGAAS